MFKQISPNCGSMHDNDQSLELDETPSNESTPKDLASAELQSPAPLRRPTRARMAPNHLSNFIHIVNCPNSPLTALWQM